MKRFIHTLVSTTLIAAAISGIGRQWEREYGNKILIGSHNPTIRISSL